jgi:uncharacterized protein YukE
MTAPDGYSHDRKNETWSSAHPPSHHANVNAARNRHAKQVNRMPGHFGKANWDAYEHYQLYNMIMKADAGQMYDRAQQWKTLADGIEDTTTEVQRVVQQVMTTWQGQAAVNAGSSATQLMQWAGTASHTAGQVASSMSSYSDAVATAQRHMPPPAFATAERNFRDGYSVMTSGGPADAILLKQLTTDAMVSQQEAHARKAEAVAVMENYESHSKSVHDQMPHFTDAAPATKDAPAFTPRSGAPGAGGAGGSGSGGPGSPGFPPAGSGVSGGSSPSGNTSTSAAGFVDPFGPSGANGLQGSNGLTGFGGGPGSLNGSGGDALRFGSGFGSGGPGGVGAFGVGGAGGPGSGAAAGMGAGALAGRGPGGVIGGPGGVAGAAGARGGAGGYGGMPLGGGRGNGEEDGEHTNKYDEGLDLFDDLPPAYPPVFGA